MITINSDGKVLYDRKVLYSDKKPSKKRYLHIPKDLARWQALGAEGVLESIILTWILNQLAASLDSKNRPTDLTFAYDTLYKEVELDKIPEDNYPGMMNKYLDWFLQRHFEVTNVSLTVVRT